MARTIATPLSPKIQRSLAKLGRDIDVARKKRRLTIESLCERAGISMPLYFRIVAGAGGTSIGAYAMVIYALGLETPFENLVDPGADDTGLLLDEARLPKRVRNSKTRTGAL